MELKAMGPLAKIYYQLTSWYPRPMPTTQEEVDKVMSVFVQAFGLEEDEQTFYTVLSNMHAIKGTSTRFYYGSLLSIAKRLKINSLLNERKKLVMQQHLDKIKKANEEQQPSEPDHESDLKLMQAGTPSVPTELPSVQEPEVGVV